MNSTTMILLLILATSALVQGIAIRGVKGSSSSAVTAETAATVSVNPNNGFAVQSGYEGYIRVPQKPSISNNNTWLALPKLQFMMRLLQPFTSFLVVFGFKAFKVVAQLFIALVLGVVSTTALCNLTPLCTISIATPELLKGQSLKERIAAMTLAYLTPSNLEMATDLAKSALETASTHHEAKEQSAEDTEEDNETVS